MDYGIYISGEVGFNSIMGNVTVCDYPNCNEVTTKYYVKGEDAEFYEMYEVSHWDKLKNRSWYTDRVMIIGFCDEHKNLSSVTTNIGENNE